MPRVWDGLGLPLCSEMWLQVPFRRRICQLGKVQARAPNLKRARRACLQNFHWGLPGATLEAVSHRQVVGTWQHICSILRHDPEVHKQGCQGRLFALFPCAAAEQQQWCPTWWQVSLSPCRAGKQHQVRHRLRLADGDAVLTCCDCSLTAAARSWIPPVICDARPSQSFRFHINLMCTLPCHVSKTSVAHQSPSHPAAETSTCTVRG